MEKNLNELDGFDNDIKKSIEGLYDKMDDILDRTKKLGTRVEKNVPLVKLNDELIDLGADISEMKKDLRIKLTANGIPDKEISELTDKLFKNLDDCKDIQKIDAFHDVFKLVEYDDGVKLQTGKILEDLDGFGKRLDAASETIGEGKDVLNRLSNVEGVDPKLSGAIEELIDGVKNPKGSSGVFGIFKGKVKAEAMFGKASKTKVQQKIF